MSWQLLIRKCLYNGNSLGTKQHQSLICCHSHVCIIDSSCRMCGSYNTGSCCTWMLRFLSSKNTWNNSNKNVKTLKPKSCARGVWWHVCDMKSIASLKSPHEENRLQSCAWPSGICQTNRLLQRARHLHICRWRSLAMGRQGQIWALACGSFHVGWGRSMIQSIHLIGCEWLRYCIVTHLTLGSHSYCSQLNLATDL